MEEFLEPWQVEEALETPKIFQEVSWRLLRFKCPAEEEFIGYLETFTTTRYNFPSNNFKQLNNSITIIYLQISLVIVLNLISFTILQRKRSRRNNLLFSPKIFEPGWAFRLKTSVEKHFPLCWCRSWFSMENGIRMVSAFDRQSFDLPSSEAELLHAEFRTDWRPSLCRESMFGNVGTWLWNRW